LEDIATVKLNYRLPGDTAQKTLRYACPHNYEELRFISNDLQFASAITMFGLLLRNSKYAASASWSEIERIAKASKTPDDYLQNEFIELVEKAKKIYPKKGRKRNN